MLKSKLHHFKDVILGCNPLYNIKGLGQKKKKIIFSLCIHK